MIGKKGVAPCGHPGEHIVGNYVRCEQCDTKKNPGDAGFRVLQCPTCQSWDVDYDFDLGHWYYYFNPAATRMNTRCRACGHCWVRR